MGAEAIKELLRRVEVDKLSEELREKMKADPSLQKRIKFAKRLKVLEAFRKSGNRPEWMILDVIPVLPPELRPLVPLDGGRFATSDLNDLYRRVINRNNRLKKLMELRAPDVIVRNEKRMLQEAVDALFDNGRRGRVLRGTNNRPLKSLSDTLKGKQGRFRQNLLGKRVDYSGRSVIVVGPELKLHQCGLPKKMALELFKPFIYHKLEAQGHCTTIKQAKEMVEQQEAVVGDILEEFLRDHPVLLNRAPTLQRLGIQAFEPVLVEGKAIKIHPLVCTAFNADFDGDQMAVHIPLSPEAQIEAAVLMLSSNNILSPASGQPIAVPSQDIVLGIYYLTRDKEGAKGEGRIFASGNEVLLALDAKEVTTQTPIKLRISGDLIDLTQEHDTQDILRATVQDSVRRVINTTVGRVIFNDSIPPGLPYFNGTLRKKGLQSLVNYSHIRLGHEMTVKMLDDLKTLGFLYATKAGISIGIDDLVTPPSKPEIVGKAEKDVITVEQQYRDGVITNGERYNKVIAIWSEATDKVAKEMFKAMDDREKATKEMNPILIMSDSGARGSAQQIRQLAGMRGLMARPSGEIIETPIQSNFREGLNVLQYFISTHGARKGLADTALKTADSGYLTRRLVDVAQDVIISEPDCGTLKGISSAAIVEGGEEIESLRDRIVGRTALEDVIDPVEGTVIVESNQEIDEDLASEIQRSGVQRVRIRSVLTCESRRGCCIKCYGRNLATGRPVDIGEAVGVIAAQSIGEPGTQLTMRTFHIGGTARLEESSKHEARVEGKVKYVELQTVKSRNASNKVLKTYQMPVRGDLMVNDVEEVEPGDVIAKIPRETTKTKDITGGLPRVVELFEARRPGEAAVMSEIDGTVKLGPIAKGKRKLIIVGDDGEEREYDIPRGTHINVQEGDRVRAGEALQDGPLNPHDILRVLGMNRLQEYLTNEIQEVYRLQGVNINDKHIEVIVRQMLRWVKIKEVGDTEFLLEEQVDRFRFQDENDRVGKEDGEVSQAEPLLLGITKASLSTDSFISAASFQETTRVLTEAAISGRIDYLRGLKENVIMGRLIPAGTGMEYYRNVNIDRDETMDQARERDIDEFPEIVGGLEIPTPTTHTTVPATGDGDAVEEE